MKKIEDLTIILLLVLLLGLASCAKPKVNNENDGIIESLANMSKAGKAIGCVFAPWNKECQRIKNDKAPHQTQEEYIKEVNEDFDNLDKEIEKSKSE
jgi:hypothetical protein